ncbi:MAG TPA: copper resistance system multicopper oxidase, partial [Candidatus Acidoferrum sp.]|nr:copper resistance system multicopper oxidase [Candidatus Acidoferrum sp.]
DMKRRRFLRSTLMLGGALGWQSLLPAWAQSNGLATLAGVPGQQGSDFQLRVSEERAPIAGRTARHIRLNGQFPAPLLRWREGDALTLQVHNALDVPTSIHWHGILVPWQMDGVPGISFDGIAPGKSFGYRFALKQSGTYWYHSHSGMQEQSGHYGPIIIDPREPEPFAYEREYVIVLSDWTFEDPERVFHKLKTMSGSYNFQQRTLGDFFGDARRDGFGPTLAERMQWGQMRMNRTDIADVTGATYTYLVNGHSPAENWTGLFKAGERIRLRLINSSAMTIFNVRIPGLPMTVVLNDGQYVQPVETDELQIGNGETFDVIVQPQSAEAFTLYAESNDRSGYARATLAPRAGMQAPVPPLRPRPLLTMKDMGMDDMAGMDMAGMDMSGMEPAAHHHPLGPGVASIATNPGHRLHERPLGLENEPHRVLVYAELRSLEPNVDQRAPTRELELHLTANMERYMWSFDGRKFTEVTTPIALTLNERVRLTFVNDTMMPHPLHLHGMFFDLVTEEGANKPHKHTLVLKPGEKASVDLTADAPGPWAFHCHLLYHMHAGMMRIFRVGDGAQT